MIRTHGDYHLGQTLRTAARLGDHRLRGRAGAPAARAPGQKRSPLRDVAGMLRSFAYARRARSSSSAASALRRTSSSAPGSASSQHYFARGRRRRCCRAGEAAMANLLSVFELEKAIYELRYELDNRPDWVGDPGGRHPPTAGAPNDRARRRRARRARPPRARQPPLRARAHPTTARSFACLRPGGLRDHRPRSPAAAPSSSSRSTPAASSRAVAAPSAAPLPSWRSTTGTPARSRSSDPYAFAPTLGELDLHLIGEGRHEEIYEQARRARPRARGRRRAVPRSRSGRPAARAVSVVGDFNSWDGRLHAMRTLGSGGDLGAVPARRRAGSAVQVRDPRRRRRAPAEGRPLRPAGRAPAEDRLGRVPARAPLEPGGRRWLAERRRGRARCEGRCRSTRCTSARGG